MMKALELEVDEPVDFKKASLNKGRIELWVEDQKSIDFLRNAIPLIPNAENNRTHKYISWDLESMSPAFSMHGSRASLQNRQE